MIDDSTRHMIVLLVKGSLKITYERAEKIMIPIAYPISLPGQTSPWKYNAERLVYSISIIDIGIPSKETVQGCVFIQLEKNCP